MTKLMEQAIRQIQTLPDDEQDFYAAILVAEMDRVPVPQWHRDLLAERDAAAGAAREGGITLNELDARDARVKR